LFKNQHNAISRQMKKIIILYFLVISAIAFAQTQNNKAGYYDLSEEGWTVGLYLLDNGLFYYSRIEDKPKGEISSYDPAHEVIFFGTYTATKNKLQLNAIDEGIQAYMLYGRKDNTYNNSIKIKQSKSHGYQRGYYSSLFAINHKWIKSENTESDTRFNEVSFTFDNTAFKTLTLGYPVIRNETHNNYRIEKIYTTTIKNGENDFLLGHNEFHQRSPSISNDPYAQNILNAFSFTKNGLLSKENITKKVVLNQKEQKDVLDKMLNSNISFPATVTVEGKTYKKIFFLAEYTRPLRPSHNKVNLMIMEITIKKKGN